jgi:hypothetical protein
MLGIALDRLDQIGNQVISPPQLYIHLGPAVIAAIPHHDEAVIDTDGRDEQRPDQNNQNQKSTHVLLPSIKNIRKNKIEAYGKKIKRRFHPKDNFID